MQISVIAPVLNEAPWIGFSIMSALPYVHEFIYSLDDASNDGTRELLDHIKEKYAHEKLRVLPCPTFHPSDMGAYNGAFNQCLQVMTGDAAWFLHPDMIVASVGATFDPMNQIDFVNEKPSDTLAWWTKVTSYAGDFQTQITKGRASRWKNIHAKKFGLNYYGGYGSQNEDFYHSEITGNAYKHYGEEFSKYPFPVSDSGISVNHYCELKSYRRRLEKMKLCLKTQNPTMDELAIDEIAIAHPRVTLESKVTRFGTFEFKKKDIPIPDVIGKYKDEFESLIKPKEFVHG